LIEDLDNSESAVRLGSAWALALLGDQRAAPVLRALLNDPEPRVAEMAARGLEFLPDTDL
jgi:HEAT repeat protein